MISTSQARPGTILCADWSKASSGRAVYAADVGKRRIFRLNSEQWTLASVLAGAKGLSLDEPVLVAVDVPLGVPESFFRATAEVAPELSGRGFLDLLVWAQQQPHFYEVSATGWSRARPFFSVPKGKGSLRAVHEAAGRAGVELYRQIDRRTHAKPAFVVSGIPGSVGSSARELWQELAVALAVQRTFKVWPFEGSLDALLESVSIVIGEMYPRAAYATALLDGPPQSRPRLIVSKTKSESRREAIAVLRQAVWRESWSVVIDDLDRAEACEDDFDACMAAAALLRCVLEGVPLCPESPHRAAAEGGILGTGSINLDLSARVFGSSARRDRPTKTSPPAPSTQDMPERSSVLSSECQPFHSCPIPGCDKVFRPTRSGWDAHVASLRTHPSWDPETENPTERKRRFREQFPGFFR